MHLLSTRQDFRQCLADVEPRAEKEAHVVWAGALIGSEADIHGRGGDLEPAGGIKSPRQTISAGVSEVADREVIKAAVSNVEVAEQFWRSVRFRRQLHVDYSSPECKEAEHISVVDH